MGNRTVGRAAMHVRISLVTADPNKIDDVVKYVANDAPGFCAARLYIDRRTGRSNHRRPVDRPAGTGGQPRSCGNDPHRPRCRDRRRHPSGRGIPAGVHLQRLPADNGDPASGQHSPFGVIRHTVSG